MAIRLGGQLTARQCLQAFVRRQTVEVPIQPDQPDQPFVGLDAQIVQVNLASA
ncbi:hypothetical protein [Paraburkholderia panacisoli]|uniref:hypothetical protein n=1 Tax=Paraburkholderia panacisoli TaxID=2603818 RepID=UPI00165F09E5|nr:hypothetical protein [Paraburkholderia panacisoli]